MSFLFALILFCASAKAEHSLEGHWFYYKKIYRGQEMPESPQATLRLHYEFFENGQSRLYWYHEGEGDWCERIGRWSVEENMLVDEVQWVNPKNTMLCGSDPDMQNGRITRTPFLMKDGEFQLFLRLGEDWLIYVWKKIGG